MHFGLDLQEKEAEPELIPVLLQTEECGLLWKYCFQDSCCDSSAAGCPFSTQHNSCTGPFSLPLKKVQLGVNWFKIQSWVKPGHVWYVHLF